MKHLKKPTKPKNKKVIPHVTCYVCFPARRGKHYFIGGKPVHTRKDCPPGMMYFVNEIEGSMFTQHMDFLNMKLPPYRHNKLKVVLSK